MFLGKLDLEKKGGKTSSQPTAKIMR